MQGADIVNQLKTRLPNYTTAFSDELSVTSLSKTGNTVTAVTAAAHGRLTGDVLVIKGAKEPITINSLTREGNLVTAICDTQHKLPNPDNLREDDIPNIQLDDTDPSEYSGIYKLKATPDYFTFQYEISTTPITPANIGGFLLIDDLGDFSYNGLKTITKIDNVTFTYTVDQDLQSPAQGIIKSYANLRVGNAAGLETAEAHYSANNSQILQNWLYVVVGDEETYRKGTVTTDVDSTQDANEEFRYDSITPFNVYVFVPAKDSSLVGMQADTARSFRKSLLKSIANFLLPSDLTEGCLKPVTYQGNGVELLTEAYYVHRFSFVSKGEIVNADTIDATNVVPFKKLEGSIEQEAEFVIDFQ